MPPQGALCARPRVCRCGRPRGPMEPQAGVAFVLVVPAGRGAESRPCSDCRAAGPVRSSPSHSQQRLPAGSPPRPPSPRRQCHTPPASCPRSPRTPWFTRAAALDVSVSNSQSRRAQVTRSCGRLSDPGARHVPALPAGPGDGALLSASSDPQWLRHPRVGGGRSSQRDRAGAGAGLAWQTPGLGVRHAALCRWRRPGEGVTSVPRGEGGQWGASAVTPLHGLSQPSRCWPRHAHGRTAVHGMFRRAVG